VINVTERYLWQVWHLRAEGVVSYELSLEKDILPDKQVYSRLSPFNLVPICIPRDIRGLIDEHDVDEHPI